MACSKSLVHIMDYIVFFKSEYCMSPFENNEGCFVNPYNIYLSLQRTSDYRSRVQRLVQGAGDRDWLKSLAEMDSLLLSHWHKPEHQLAIALYGPLPS